MEIQEPAKLSKTFLNTRRTQLKPSWGDYHRVYTVSNTTTHMQALRSYGLEKTQFVFPSPLTLTILTDVFTLEEGLG